MDWVAGYTATKDAHYLPKGGNKWMDSSRESDIKRLHIINERIMVYIYQYKVKIVKA